MKTGYSIVENYKCSRCFRRVPLKYLKGGLCKNCRETLDKEKENLNLSEVYIPVLEEKMGRYKLDNHTHVVPEDSKAEAYTWFTANGDFIWIFWEA